MVNMKYSKLKGAIREKYGRQSDFAAALGMSQGSLSGKLNGRNEWTRIEIERACGLLDVPLCRAHLYFFSV